LDDVRRAAGGEAEAICCGFPGPADYRAGVVGPQKNLPCIREPLALGALLEERFGVPALLRNDADLFVFGEALGGFLPWLNRGLEEAGSRRRYRSLFGITLGTGLGAGFTLEGRMVTGDHGGGPEIWCFPSGPDPGQPSEEHASVRAVVHSYAQFAGVDPEEVPAPKVLAEVARGHAPGDAGAAREAFRRLGEAAGHAAAQAVSLLDCPLVVGGGLSGAGDLLLPALLDTMNAPLKTLSGLEVSSMDGRAFGVESPEAWEAFFRAARDSPAERIFPVGIARLGTSRAAALGAYATAMEALDRQKV
jgi:glucokinase